MTKKEFIARFNLTDTGRKCVFHDGRAFVERTLYIDPNDEMYVFYKNDLHTFYKYNSPSCRKDIGFAIGRIGAGYSWYR